MDIRQSAAAGAGRPTDIQVQPVRAPAPPEPPAPAPAGSPGLEPAVQVDLSEKARDAKPDRAAPEAERQFVRDPDSEALVFQVSDPVSGEILAQLPDVATLRARIYARELEARASAQTGQPGKATVAIA